MSPPFAAIASRQDVARRSTPVADHLAEALRLLAALPSQKPVPTSRQSLPSAAWGDALGVLTDVALRAAFAGRQGKSLGLEPGEALTWRALLEAEADAGHDFCAVELGAGWGPWLARAGAAWRRRHPTRPARLVGVEGEPSHAGALHEHLRRNALLGPRTTILEGAVCDRHGEIAFALARDPWCDWRTGPCADERPEDLGIGWRRVPAHSLTTLLAPLPTIDFLHVDIEGDLPAILRAGAAAIAQKVDRLYLVPRRPGDAAQLLDVLPDLGFTLQGSQEADATRDGGQYWLRAGGPGVRRPQSTRRERSADLV